MHKMYFKLQQQSSIMDIGRRLSLQEDLSTQLNISWILNKNLKILIQNI